jgi:hypothetical protein
LRRDEPGAQEQCLERSGVLGQTGATPWAAHSLLVLLRGPNS